MKSQLLSSLITVLLVVTSTTTSTDASPNCIAAGQTCDRESFDYGCCRSYYCSTSSRTCMPFVRLFGYKKQGEEI